MLSDEKAQKEFVVAFIFLYLFFSLFFFNLVIFFWRGLTFWGKLITIFCPRRLLRRRLLLIRRRRLLQGVIFVFDLLICWRMWVA
ncbi:hypothetical protein P8452_07665 [Trifolium repens]|nr:hypothetical protein P8452_07665 [Trifolium repens]